MQFKISSLVLLMAVAFSANAEVSLTEKDLLGTWKINKEAINKEGTDAKTLNSVWTFRNDGTMEGVSNDTNAHARVSEIRATVKYSIEEGKLVKQASPGRSKFETCTAIERNGNDMVLECNHIFFFMTKK